MAGQIRITPDQMRIRANEFRQEGEIFQDCINNMQSLINNLQGEWEGLASEKCASQFEELKPNFVAVHDLINEIGGQLDAAATEIENLDQDIANRLRI